MITWHRNITKPVFHCRSTARFASYMHHFLLQRIPFIIWYSQFLTRITVLMDALSDVIVTSPVWTERTSMQWLFRTVYRYWANLWAVGRLDLTGCATLPPECAHNKSRCTYSYFLYTTTVIIISFLYLLTYSMEQSPPWEANWFCS